MATLTTKDGTQIYYKDWGSGQPIVFHHGWPLSRDDWDAQMLYFVEKDYRVVGIDRPLSRPELVTRGCRERRPRTFGQDLVLHGLPFVPSL